MSSIDVNNTINQMQNETAQSKAATATTGTSKIDGDTFLQLMLEQLKYQDPMDPVSNEQFLTQQAQFTTLSETQEMNKNIASNNSVMQTLAVVGKDVVLTDPADAKNTISGTVTDASFSTSGGSVTVNGKEYPIAYLKSVKESTATASK